MILYFHQFNSILFSDEHLSSLFHLSNKFDLSHFFKYLLKYFQSYSKLFHIQYFLKFLKGESKIVRFFMDFYINFYLKKIHSVKFNFIYLNSDLQSQYFLLQFHFHLKTYTLICYHIINSLSHHQYHLINLI